MQVRMSDEEMVLLHEIVLDELADEHAVCTVSNENSGVVRMSNREVQLERLEKKLR